MAALAKDYNVLLILSDQHARDVTGCYGHPMVQTPHMDRLAAGGVRFDAAYCPSPLCGPSRSSILTATHCHTCGGLTHTQPADMREMPTMGDAFRSAGYVTGAIGKVHVLGESADRDLGFDERALRYYTYQYRDYIEAVGADNVNRYNSYRIHSGVPARDCYNPAHEPIAMDEPAMYDALVVERCKRFLRDHAGQRFFLWAGLEKPHPEWYAPAQYHAMYDAADVALPETLRDEPPDIPAVTRQKLQIAGRYSDEQVRRCIAAYYANVTYLDAKVGELLGELDRLALADRTIVIYCSDHGELLFAHGMCQKHSFYEPAVAVPLIMSCPGAIPAGAARTHLVSLMDLLPTLCDLTGVAAAGPVEGRSLVDVIEGRAEEDGREVFSEFYSWGAAERMIRTGRWKYVHTDGNVAQLYDTANDPLERVNLAADPARAAIVRDLDARVRAGWEMPDKDFIQPRARRH